MAAPWKPALVFNPCRSVFHLWLNFLFLIPVLLWGFAAFADEVIPPAPKDFFNDYAHVTSPATATRLNDVLREFERQTSSQIWVVIYPTMQSDSSIDEYTVRVARAWKTGLKGKDNGAILFVFTKEHKMFIQVGYGLEGVLPDILCKRIIEDEIGPRLKQGDFDGGMSAGVGAIIAATKGEYKGTGRTVADNAQGISRANAKLLTWLIVIVVFIIFAFFRRGSGGGGGGGFGGGSGWWLAANVLSSMANSGRGGGWSSGGGGWSGGSGGGGTGAMGGGGSFGGGGAGGSW